MTEAGNLFLKWWDGESLLKVILGVTTPAFICQVILFNGHKPAVLSMAVNM